MELRLGGYRTVKTTSRMNTGGVALIGEKFLSRVCAPNLAKVMPNRRSPAQSVRPYTPGSSSLLENTGFRLGRVSGMGVMTAEEGEKLAVAKILELTSRSSESFDDAIESGIEKAGESVDNIQSAWVKDQQVILSAGSINEYQVTLKLTFLVN